MEVRLRLAIGVPRPVGREGAPRGLRLASTDSEQKVFSISREIIVFSFHLSQGRWGVNPSSPLGKKRPDVVPVSWLM